MLGDFKCTRRTPTSGGVLSIGFRNSSRELLDQHPHRDPHDVDRVANDIGGAFFTFGAVRHLQTSRVVWPFRPSTI